MAWEKRNKNKYYYRKVRDGDKVSSVYLGKDILAYKISSEAQKHKLQSQKQEAQISLEQAHDEELEQSHRLLIAIAEATLLLNGYHLHKGQWRKIHG
jgi:hypothetical protein